MQIVPSKENLRTHANEMPVHSVPGLLPRGHSWVVVGNWGRQDPINIQSTE